MQNSTGVKGQVPTVPRLSPLVATSVGTQGAVDHRVSGQDLAGVWQVRARIRPDGYLPAAVNCGRACVGATVWDMKQGGCGAADRQGCGSGQGSPECTAQNYGRGLEGARATIRYSASRGDTDDPRHDSGNPAKVKLSTVSGDGSTPGVAKGGPGEDPLTRARLADADRAGAAVAKASCEGVVTSVRSGERDRAISC